jgi:hypothetical protein
MANHSFGLPIRVDWPPQRTMRATFIFLVPGQ